MNPETLNDVSYLLAQRNYHVAMGLILGFILFAFIVVTCVLAIQWVYAFKARRKAQAFRNGLHERLNANVILEE